MKYLKTIFGIEQSIKYLKIFYGLYGAIIFLFFCFYMIGAIKHKSIDGWVLGEYFLLLSEFGFTYYGLKNRREWVIPLILSSSAVEIWTGLVATDSIDSFVEKCFYFGLGLFQIYFFRMPQTKYYFNDNSNTFL